MLRTFIWILTLCLSATPFIAHADADLVPLPWTSAGFAAPEGQYTSSSTESVVAITRPVSVVIKVGACFITGGGFGSPPFMSCSASVAPVVEFDNGAILVSTPDYQFQATLASVVSGNKWTVELLNPALTITNPAVPGQVPNGKVVTLHLAIDAFPSATFTVSDVSSAPSEAVMFRSLPSVPASSGRLPLLEARSTRLAESLVPFTPGFLEPFLDNDQITVLGRVSFQFSFDSVYFPISTQATVAGVSFGTVDPCGTATSFTEMPIHACKVGVEILEANPKTSVASLACRADLNKDGVVNFADLGQLKSVFFQSCQQQ